MIDEQNLRELAEAANLSTKQRADMTALEFEDAEAKRFAFRESAPTAILALLDELQSLRSERTAWRVSAENAEKDAARYRWLRAKHWEENRIGVVVRPKDNTKLGCFLPSDTLLDDTIDHMSAIEATEETP